MTAGGTYTLVVELPERQEITVGALGAIDFESGWYAYVGSALGKRGFARTERHRELARGERETRHWHIDYLLGQRESSVDRIVKTADIDGECRVAEALDCEPIPAFGCSDCHCESHLFYSGRRAQLIERVQTAHENLGGP